MRTYAFVFVLCLLSCSEATLEQTPPNVIFILTDDQGYGDLGIYGAKDFSTPNLDKLAREGVYFTSYYATQPVCSASRASILTGCYPNRIGIHNAFMPNAKIGLNPTETTIAELLKEEGYATGIFGKWHLGDAAPFLPTKQGFDEFYGILYSNDMWPYHPQQGSWFNFDDIFLYKNEEPIRKLTDQSTLTREFTQEAINFISTHKDQPFFVYLPHPQPHVPLFAHEDYEGTQDRGLYGDVIHEIDHEVGRLVQHLEDLDLLENTIIVFTSDNGPWLSYGGHSGSSGIYREGKGTNWEGGHRVPAIVSYPKSIKSPKIIDQPAMGIDWLPTIAEWTKAKMPELKIDGKSLVPLMTNASAVSPHKNFFFYYRVNELHAIRHEDYKLYLPHTYRSLNGRVGTNDGLPINYEMNKIEAPELYHLIDDPTESVNIADKHPEKTREILKIADSIRMVLGDALTEQIGNEVREAGKIKVVDQ
jgi:arylsulfatase